MGEYIVADPDVGAHWSHVFLKSSEGEVERSCRFVVDRDTLELLHLDVDKDGAMVPANASEARDLLDNFLHGNPRVVDDPVSSGLVVSNRLPQWCRGSGSYPVPRTGSTEPTVRSQPGVIASPPKAPASDLPEDGAPNAEAELVRDLVKLIARDVGDAAAAHVEIMYPAVVAAAASTFLLSLRNTVYNEILAATNVNDVDRMVARLAERKRARRKLKAAYREMRKDKPE